MLIFLVVTHVHVVLLIHLDYIHLDYDIFSYRDRQTFLLLVNKVGIENIVAMQLG